MDNTFFLHSDTIQTVRSRHVLLLCVIIINCVFLSTCADILRSGNIESSRVASISSSRQKGTVLGSDGKQ